MAHYVQHSTLPLMLFIMPLVGWPINFPLELPLNKASKESIKQSKLNTLICLFYHQRCLRVLADSVRRPAGQLSHINRLKRSSNKLLKLNRNCLFSWKQLILLYWDQGLQRAIPANWDQFESLCLLAGWSLSIFLYSCMLCTYFGIAGQGWCEHAFGWTY